MESATCKKCGETKTLSLFPKRARDANSKVRTNRCKACAASYMRAWKNASPERKEYDRQRSKLWQQRHPDYTKRTNLRLSYGMTLEEYESLLGSQNGVCAICSSEDLNIVKRTGKRRSLAVDHCHETGMIRALLCGDCNRALGLVKESPVILAKMISYLARFSGVKTRAA